MESMRARVRRKPVAGCFWLSSGSPALVEMSLSANPESVVIDAQHGLWDRAGLEAAMGLLRGRTHAIVRTMDHSKGAISTALDAGAEGVIVPLIETAAQAADAVEASRYPPEGKRSAGGVRPLNGDFAAYYRAARAETFVGLMIETVAGYESAQSIIAVPGVDMIFIGTGDLALSLGTFPDPDPRHEEICLSIRDSCRRAGVACGIFTPHAEAAARRAAQGFDLVVIANDGDIIARGFATAIESYAATMAQSSASAGKAAAAAPKTSKTPAKPKSAKARGN